MGNPVFYFEIMTQDAPALRPFYEELFGWTFAQPAPGAGNVDYATVKPNERAGIEGGIGTAPDGYAGHVTFYISVSDVAKALAQIETHDGTVMMGPDRVPGGPVIGLFCDPQGNTVGLLEFPG